MTSVDGISAQSYLSAPSALVVSAKAPGPDARAALARGPRSVPLLSITTKPGQVGLLPSLASGFPSEQSGSPGWHADAIDPALRSPAKQWPHIRNIVSHGNDSQYPSPSTDSPPTPSSAGLDFGLSRQSSLSDFASVVRPSSEDGDTGSGRGGADSNGDADAGVPPPKPKKKSHARKQPEGHIKRSRNSYILFRKHLTDSGLIPQTIEAKQQNISVVASKMWREAPPDVRQKFEEQARIEKEEHHRKYPGYRYQPVGRRSDIIRRRVRKDPSEDEKVEAVAKALIHGKHGNELETEIRSKDLAKSDAESDTDSRGSRRRHRDVGQLSKGALRAQRAQNRAKAMRQNLLGSSLANMQIYSQNAAYQAAAAAAANGTAYRGVPQHPGAAHLYGMSSEYAPMAYDIEGRPVMQPYYEGYDDMQAAYRLPPIEGMEHGGAGWDAGQTDAYYHADVAQAAAYSIPQQDAQYEQYLNPDAYRAPAPLELAGEPSMGEGSRPPRPADIVTTSYGREPWPTHGQDGAAAQQTPSGHVVFNERLFGGELGSATFERDDGLGDFGDAVAQVGETDVW